MSRSIGKERNDTKRDNPSVRRVPFDWLILGALLAGAGCSDSPGHELDEKCERDGLTYAPGDTVPSSDCNSCICQDDGQIACTLLGCASGGSGSGASSSGAGGSGVSTGSGGATSGSGGSSASGGSIGGGGAGDGRCDLPFEGGDCDAAIPVYWHNPATHECEPQVYGGCGGNDNRFDTLEDCQGTCDVAPSGVACEVDGLSYPHGSGSVPDPGSCNTCSCNEGQLANCTKINCPVECPTGTTVSTECAKCGPTDACELVRTACLPTCSEDDECDGRLCIDGICRSLCG